MTEAVLPVEPEPRLALGAEPVGDVARADQHDHDRLLAAVLLQGLERVPAHRRVPGALGAEHPLEHRVGHAAVERVRLAEEGAEEPLVLGALGVDSRRQQRPLLGRERVEALRARRLHHVARHVDAEHADPVRRARTRRCRGSSSSGSPSSCTSGTPARNASSVERLVRDQRSSHACSAASPGTSRGPPAPGGRACAAPGPRAAARRWNSMSVWLSPTNTSFTPSSRAASSGGVITSPRAASVMPSSDERDLAAPAGRVADRQVERALVGARGQGWHTSAAWRSAGGVWSRKHLEGERRARERHAAAYQSSARIGR